jgi:hypothetical protein
LNTNRIRGLVPYYFIRRLIDCRERFFATSPTSCRVTCGLRDDHTRSVHSPSVRTGGSRHPPRLWNRSARVVIVVVVVEWMKHYGGATARKRWKPGRGINHSGPDACPNRLTKSLPWSDRVSDGHRYSRRDRRRPRESISCGGRSLTQSSRPRTDRLAPARRPTTAAATGPMSRRTMGCPPGEIETANLTLLTAARVFALFVRREVLAADHGGSASARVLPTHRSQISRTR